MHQALIILPISHAKQRSAIQTNLSNLRISKRMLAPPQSRPHTASINTAACKHHRGCFIVLCF